MPLPKIFKLKKPVSKSGILIAVSAVVVCAFVFGGDFAVPEEAPHKKSRLEAQGQTVWAQVKKTPAAAVSAVAVCAFVFGLDFVVPEVASRKKPRHEMPVRPVWEQIKEAPAAAVSAAKFMSGMFKPNPEIDVPIIGDLRAEILNERTICLVGSYEKFLQKRFPEECGGFLKGIDSSTANLPPWTRNVFYDILGAEIILKYRPVIAEMFSNGTNFKISGDVEIAQTGCWLNPAGQMRFPQGNGLEEKLTRNASVTHYAFLRLKQPLKSGVTHVLTLPSGQKIEFNYDPDKNISGAIKTNQLGYSPAAGRKYAYVGGWLGTMGPLDTAQIVGQKFYLTENASGRRVFTGEIRRRGAESYFKNGVPFTGEEVCELDFSAFRGEGEFFLFVPGFGRSEAFQISNSAVGEAFYVHARGLYHKRCGMAKEKPFTNWTMGACHMQTYAGGFPPNNRHYWPTPKEPDRGFFNEQGKAISVSHFKLISLGKTDTALDLRGGWHDAADYDRRPYHYDVVNDLLSVYLFRPENFGDSQLNIPESGNGIPDILDEAAWGMEVWLNAQTKDGAVPGWIEADSHPREHNPAKDTQRYYLSAATRESTMQYAAHASMLALALKNAGDAAGCAKYADSAMRAYRWASEASNRFEADYQYPVEEKSGKASVVYQKIHYTEAKHVPAQYVFKCAFNLWLLTGRDEFLVTCKSVEGEMSWKFAETSWRVNPLFFSEYLKYGKSVKGFEKIRKSFESIMMKYAGEKLERLENNYPYRIPWYPSGHHYVTHMGWGVFHPLNSAKFFVNAFELSGDKKYSDAAYLCNDWHCGANPTGQTMTSGLGKNYPVRFLDLASYADGIEEFVPGITPYRNTFGIPRDDVVLAHSLMYSPQPDRGFKPSPVMLLPASVVGVNPTNPFAVAKSVGAVWPIWRRFGNVEAYTVGVSEFTVSETIAPAAAVTGWLLTPGYFPTDALKQRMPEKDLANLKGFAPLP